MDTLAVLLKAPQELALSRLSLVDPGEDDVVVDVEWSGISTGTERLLYTGRMPPFPGMGYPLVPGYESVGRVVEAGARAGRGARSIDHDSPFLDQMPTVAIFDQLSTPEPLTSRRRAATGGARR